MVAEEKMQTSPGVGEEMGFSPGHALNPPQKTMHKSYLSAACN